MIVMLGAGGLFFILERVFGAEAPRTFFGHELPTGDSREERNERLRAYAVDAALFAVVITVLTFGGICLVGDTSSLDMLPVGGAAGLALLAALELVVGGLIYFALNWLLGESAARGVEKKLARLDA